MNEPPEVRPRLLPLLLFLVLSLAFGWLSLSFYPAPRVFAGTIFFLAAGLFILSAGFVGWGALILRTLKAPAPVDLIGCWAAGAAGTATLWGLVGRAWFPRPWAVLCFLTVGILLAGRFRAALKRPAWPGWPGGYALLTGLFCLPPFLLALAPPISLDALVYHLAVPHQAMVRGTLIELPANVHTFFPLPAEMLYGLALPFPEGARLAQTLHLLAGLLSLIVLFRLGKRLLGRGSWLPVLGLVTVPVLNVVMGWAWNEWFLVLYMVLGLEHRFGAGEKDESSPLPAWLFFSAAAAVKYYALPLLLFLPVSRPRPKTLAAGILLLCIVLSPWYGKNLLLTGNPVYPLFGSEDAGTVLTQYRGEAEGIPFAGYLGRKDLLDESVGVLLPVLLFLALFPPGEIRKRLLLPALVVCLYLGGALLFHPTVRYFTPVFVLAALFGGLTLESLRAVKGFRVLVDGAVVLLLCVNLVHIVKICSFYEPVPPALGIESKEHYLMEGQNYYDAFGRINRAARSAGERDGKVMLVGESRIFYLACPAVAGSYLDPPPYRAYLGALPSPDALAANLARDEILLLYLNREQYRPGEPVTSYSDELVFSAEPEEDVIFQAMLRRYGTPLYRKGPIEIYALSESPGTGTEKDRDEP